MNGAPVLQDNHNAWCSELDVSAESPLHAYAHVEVYAAAMLDTEQHHVCM